MNLPAATPHVDAFLNLEGLTALQTKLMSALKDKITSVISGKELTLTVSPQHLATVLGHLQKPAGGAFTQLMSICGVDYLGFPTPQPQRFCAVYHLLSLTENQRLRIKVFVEEGATIPTATTLYPSAGWYERETYDMFGIVFEGNEDLRRLLTDYGFEGHPLRKDFPLEGHVEAYYDAEQKRVAYKPVDLPQDFRHFDNVSEWQGMTGNAPLAETDKPFTKEEFK